MAPEMKASRTSARVRKNAAATAEKEKELAKKKAASATKHAKPQAAGKKPPPKKVAPQFGPVQNGESNVTVTFRANHLLSLQGATNYKRDGLFPPTIHSNAHYERGIRLFPSKKLDVRAAVGDDSAAFCTLMYSNYTAQGSPCLAKPVLEATKAMLWTQHLAATTASKHLQFPISTYRLLGTVTREVRLQKPQPAKAVRGKKPRSEKAAHYPQTVCTVGNKTNPLYVDLAKARREVDAEIRAGKTRSAARERRAAELVKLWNGTLAQQQPCPSNSEAPWDVHGNWLRHKGDTDYVPVHVLSRWVQAAQRKHIDDGQDHDSAVLAELLPILRACLNLQSPVGLWKIPLLSVYPVVTRVHRGSNVTSETDGPPQKKQRQDCVLYEVRLAVYAHRLLAEATTTNLGIIMNALDEGSYHVSQPLCRPPAPSAAPVFCSRTHPAVYFDRDEHDDDASSERAASPSTDAARNKENEQISESGRKILARGPVNKDSASEGGDWIQKESTREGSRVSAFTPTGLLKLLENTGTDTRHFEATLRPLLQKSLQVDLMLHQEHAIAWMVQMENLKGFGINSLLWEEREFGDGGKYYYCPALGQLRLQPPARGKYGGLLCDEMGLGKTVEVLGLIMATMSKTKAEAAARRQRNALAAHATLIVVPPALVAQWEAEVEKLAGASLTVLHFDETAAQLVDHEEPPDVDVVLCTYPALAHAKTARFLRGVHWARIVLDEMQEVRSPTSTIAKMCEKLQSNRRWMLSGTPLFDGIQDLCGELNFLGLEPFSASSEDGFFRFMIADPWEAKAKVCIDRLKVLSSVLLRRSKSMLIRATQLPLMGLKPLTVQFAPVQQTNSERAIYYWLESVVAEEVRAEHDKSATSRKLCLRLLRDSCNSTILLNGGMGVGSELGELNRLVIRSARRRNGSIGEDADETTGETAATALPALSCNEAINFLAVIQKSSRSGDDEVSGLLVGLGGGVSRRDRANESTREQKLCEAEARLREASKQNHQAKSTRAKARWHFTMEKVTTGFIPEDAWSRVSSKYRSLWRWRSAVALRWAPVAAMLVQTNGTRSNDGRPSITITSNIPEVLCRGWRPSTSFVRNLSTLRPDYYWAHLNRSFLLRSIPNEASADDLTASVAKLFFGTSSGTPSQQRFRVVSLPSSSTTTWTAGLVFDHDRDARFVRQKASLTNGFELHSKTATELEQKHIAEAEAQYQEQRARFSVLPTEENDKKKRNAKKTLEQTKAGLRIVHSPKLSIATHVLLSPAHGSFRDLRPPFSHILYDLVSASVKANSSAISRTSPSIADEERKVSKYSSLLHSGISEHVQAMSAFDTLQALADGEPHKTNCAICLMELGDTRTKVPNGEAGIIMTKCGHLFCRACLDGYLAHARHPQCPHCRKDLPSRNDFVLIDPTKKGGDPQSNREEAKKLIVAASRMFEESNGQLSPEMWNCLYNSIDLPEGADNHRDAQCPALKGCFLAHVRHATNLPVHCNARQMPANVDTKSPCLSSKVKALLRDLPRNERSVVFSSSRVTIQHLQCVLKCLNIGCRALFSGQVVEKSEEAISDWHSAPESGIPVPVLLVQAGAAASGLTLTAASKMFIMEPFTRMEEEQQAYARIHRFGQTKPCQVKVYYTPVSIESRLLEWRKRSTSDEIESNEHMTSKSEADVQVVYATIGGDDEEGEDENSDSASEKEEHEMNQTKFLLGLHE